MRVPAAERGLKFPWAALVGSLALLLLLRLASLDLPLDRDEGEYATLAWAWMRGLGLPYRDFLEQKPPLAILAYGAAFFSGGFSVLSLRVFALLWQALSCAALFALAWRLSRSGRTAFLAAALYAALSASGAVQGLSANTESFVSLPMLGTLGVLSYGRGRRHWLLAGIFIGLAGLAKQSALPAALLVPLTLGMREDGPWKGRLRALSACLAGAAAPWALCLFAFAFAGAAGAFWRCVIAYNLEYAGQGLPAQASALGSGLKHLGREEWALWIALGFAARAAWQGGLPGSGAAWAWLGAMFLGCMLSGRYYPHYFQVLAAPTALLVALGFSAQPRVWLRRGLVAAFALVFIFKNFALWAAPDGAARSELLYGLPAFARAPQTAEALARATPEGSRILVWGSEAELYFLSRRRPATRFLFHYPFSGEAPRWGGGDDEVLAAMEDPATAAVLLVAGLDRNDPMQKKMGLLLQKNYELRFDLAPGALMGVRKRP